jgi:dephospho-CoA kinase
VPVLGVTGGIATGKSSFTRCFLRFFPAELFDADQCAHDLLANDLDVHQAILQTFGEAACDAAGKPDRQRLRALVFENDTRRRQLEAILHPIIRARWTARAEDAARSDSWLLVDIPLLFETQVESRFDRIIVVACSARTQQQRLREKRGLSPELADNILRAQLDLGTKTKLAHHVIWNDSAPSCLERQAGLLAGWLRRNYG